MNQRAQKQRAPMKRSTRLALITIASLMGLALVTWGAIVLALANKDLPAEEAEERRRATFEYRLEKIQEPIEAEKDYYQKLACQNQGQIRYATYDPQIEPKDLTSGTRVTQGGPPSSNTRSRTRRTTPSC